MTNLGKSIVGIIIILVVLAGGYYFTRSSSVASNQMSDNNISTTTQTNANTVMQPVATTTAPATSGKKIPFTQFLAQGGAHTCTVNQNIGDTTSKGTLYMDGDKIAGEFTATIQGKSVTTNFIVLDGYTYTWTSMMPTMGFKIKRTTPVESTSTVTATQRSGWNADQIGDYSCDTWTVDESKFTLPSSVTFKTMSS